MTTYKAQSVCALFHSSHVILCVTTIRFLGVDFKVKVMDAAGPDGRPKRVKVTIWDTGY